MSLTRWKYQRLFVHFLVLLFKLTNASTSVLYDKIQQNSYPLPTTNNGPLPVKIGMYIESLGKFMSAEMSFDADLYLYMNWKDPNLAHNEPEYVLINDPQVKDYIWMPDLYMSNSRAAKYHEIMVPNFSMFIAQDGTIAYSGRLTITVACNLNLVNYPMDRQKCQIRTLSYAYIASKVNITWFSNEPIRANSEISLPEFKIEGIKPAYCDGSYRYAIMDTTYKRDRFSCLEVDIYLRRAIGYHVLIGWKVRTTAMERRRREFASKTPQFYVSFWIDRRAVPARVTLSFTTLLSLSTLGNGLRIGLPQVSYAKALDLWFGICMFFVFLNLLEFALVNSYMRQAEKYEKMARTVSKRTKPRAQQASEDDFEPTSKDSIYLYSQNGGLRQRAETTSPHAQSRSPAYQNPLAAANWAGCSPFPRHAAVDSNVELKEIVSRRTPKSDSFFMPLDESPTKTTFMSDDDLMDGLNAFGSRRLGNPNGHYSQMQPRRRRFPIQRTPSNNPMQNNEFIRTGFDYSRKGLQVDKLSRIGFPVAFLAFNILYWGYYLWFLERNISQDDFGD